MDAKERYDLLKKLLEEVKNEESYPLPIDCVLQTGSENVQFCFTLTGRINFDDKIVSHNPIIPKVIDDGNIKAVKAEIRHIYKCLFESILDRLSGIGCERILSKQKPKEALIQDQQYKVYGTSQVPPKTILVSYGDELWRGKNAISKD